MFKIGDFAQIGRVSGRQLRHYDRLGLLEPEHIDSQTGYRYYSASQLPRLNRILALKELGLSLDQIGRMLAGKVPVDALREMLSIRKAQVEQTLTFEQQRLRQIEARIQQIEEQGALRDYDVNLKAEPSYDYLSVRAQPADMDEAIGFLRLVAAVGTRQISRRFRDKFLIVAHTDFENQALDLEVGFSLTTPINKPVVLNGTVHMEMRRLEAEEAMATIVRSGPAYQSHLAYGALGIWMEANDFQISGPCREVFLETPFQDPQSDHVVLEIQFPVMKAA